MKKLMILSIVVLGLEVGNPAFAKSMTCNVWGCSNDTVSVTETGGAYVFTFSENALTDYHLNFDFTDLLQKAKLIGQTDRADYAWFEVEKKSCKIARTFGDITCRGKVRFGAIRVRLDEEFIGVGPKRTSHTWKEIAPTPQSPWTFELITFPGDNPGEYEWALSLAMGQTTHDFYPFALKRCRHASRETL